MEDIRSVKTYQKLNGTKKRKEDEMKQRKGEGVKEENRN